MQVQQLVVSAQQAMQGGRLDEAMRLWGEVLNASPDHPQALFFQAQHKLRLKDPAAALKLFERAAKSDPKAAAIPFHAASAHRAMGDISGEIAALERALTVDPYFFPALLAKATALDRMGRPKSAAQVYKYAISCAPSEDQLPPELREQVARARASVERNAEELERHLEMEFTPQLQKLADAGTARLRECRDILLGRKKAFVQQPTMLHVPGLPPVQFYDRDLFPWMSNLEAMTSDIRDEFLAVYRADNPEFVPYIDRPSSVPLNQWAELNRSPRWSVFFLWKDGHRLDEHCQRCPRTTDAIWQLPLADMPGFGPTANFSVLAPKTLIPPHTGSTNARLIVHLPLIVPPGCSYRVGNDTREWEEGKAWVFDDTIEHEAWNGSDRLRTILMFDIWNPYLSAGEREMVSALLRGLKSFYRDEVSNWNN